MGLALASDVLADTEANEQSEEAAKLQERLDQTTAFAGAWTTSLISVMDRELPPEAVASVLEACGRACAERSSAGLITSYAGDPEGLLAKMKELWLDGFTHDPERRRIELVGREIAECYCPIHPADGSASFCECSNGHMRHVFSRVLGRPVEVELVSSRLSGSTRCSWTITYGGS
jgi:predicted ArsR family transcriptional regulator